MSKEEPPSNLVSLDLKQPKLRETRRRIQWLLGEAKPECEECARSTCDRHDTRLQRAVFLLVPGGMVGWIFSTWGSALTKPVAQGICLALILAGAACYWLDKRRARERQMRDDASRE